MNYDLLKLSNWINKDKVGLISLSINLNSIHLLEQNLDKIYWYNLL